MDGGTFTWVASPSAALETDIPNWRALTGQTREELLGDGWLSALHPDDRPRVEVEWEAALADHRASSVTYRVGTTEGEWRHFAIHGVPVVGDAGEVLRFAGMGQDVTDRELDRELLQAVLAKHGRRTPGHGERGRRLAYSACRRRPPAPPATGRTRSATLRWPMSSPPAIATTTSRCSRCG